MSAHPDEAVEPVAPVLRLRPPTGRTPWPLVLVEGAEKSGKTWESLTLSGDPRIAATWALDLGEDSLDEYRDVPSADFEMIVHDGTWGDIIGQMQAAVAASEQLEAEGKVPLLVVDSVTFEWDMLRSWTYDRAKRAKNNRRILAADPDAEIKASRNLWNDADSRHQNFMGLCRRFRGPVVLTARGKVISATAENGQPVPAGPNGVQPKDYRVEAKDGIGFAVNAWVRFSREKAPQVIGLRHVKYGIRPGIDRPREIDKFSLSWLIFDLMGCAQGETRQRSTIELNADQVMPGEEPLPVDDDPAPRGQHTGGQQQRTRPRQDRGADPQMDRHRSVVDGLQYVFDAGNVDAAAKRHAWAQRSPIHGDDVSGALGSAAHLLVDVGLVRGQRITFTDVAELVVVWVGKHKQSVAQGLANPPAQPEPEPQPEPAPTEPGPRPRADHRTVESEFHRVIGREVREVQRTIGDVG